jgi:hypothetical protein
MIIHFVLVLLLVTTSPGQTSQEPTFTNQNTSGLETPAVSEAEASAVQSKDDSDTPPTGNSSTISKSNVDPDPLTTREKFHVFGRRMISPVNFAKSAFTASINQAENSPEAWGQGVAGFAKRYGHKITNRTVENGIGFLVSVPLRQDPRYFRSTETGLWRRARHAFMSTVLTRTDSGTRTFATWRFAGNYGAQAVSNAWRPERYRTVSDTLLRGTVSIGYDAASNFFKEIWPDIKRTLFRR